MRMEKTDMEFVQFDANDVIMTSAGGDYAFVKRSVLYNNYVGSDQHNENYTFFVGNLPVDVKGDEWIQVTREKSSSTDEFGTVIYDLKPTGNTVTSIDEAWGTIINNNDPLSIVNWLNYNVQ